MCMSHPRHVLFSDDFPSHASFLKDSGSSRFRVSDGYIGLKSVWMTNRAALFARSIQCLSLTVIVMMSSIIPSIDASVDIVSTAEGYSFARWFADWCLSSCGSKDLRGMFR